jgi:hypothetical protein
MSNQKPTAPEKSGVNLLVVFAVSELFWPTSQSKQVQQKPKV